MEYTFCVAPLKNSEIKLVDFYSGNKHILIDFNNKNLFLSVSQMQVW